MFSIATIPGQTAHDVALREALQANVSAVVMALREEERGGTARASV